MLNRISREFRTKVYGSIPSPSSRNNKEEIVFMPHDTFPILTNYSTGDLPCERMPDIIGVFLSFLCEKYEGYENFDLTRMSTEVAEGRIPHEGEKTSKTGVTRYPRTEWKDIHLTMELKCSRPITIPESWDNKQVLETSNVKATTVTRQSTPSVKAVENTRPAVNPTTISQTQAAPDPVKMPNVGSGSPGNVDTNALKRVREEEGTTSKGERPRKSSRGNNGEPSNREATITRPPPDVQCAYYGAERLAASFFITHSIVVLIDGMVISPHVTYTN